MGFEFPNLPYLIDGDNKITESKAILKYTALKAGRRDLLGLDDDKKLVEIEVAYNAIDDIQNDIIKLIMTKGDFQAEKDELFEKGGVKTKLDLLSKNLRAKEWLTGATASTADIFMFEVLDFIYEIEAAQIENRKNLADFRSRFLALPQIKAHRESEDSKGMWFYPGLTAWNNAPSQ